MENVKEEVSFIKKQLLEMQKYGLSGYPTIDKPWEKFYNEEELKKTHHKRTVYQEIYENNKRYTNDLAIEYFFSKIDYKTLFNNINATAKAFEEYGIKKGSFATICAAGIPETAYSFYGLSKIGAVANMIAPHFDKNDFIDRIEEIGRASCRERV